MDIDQAQIIELPSTPRPADGGPWQELVAALQGFVDSVGPVELFTALEQVTHDGKPLVGRKHVVDMATGRRGHAAYWVSHHHRIGGNA